MNAKLASFASVAMLLPLNALAETVALTCTLERLDKDGASLGTRPLSLAYKGDASTGVLTVESPWGQITFAYAEYTAGDAPGDYKIVGNWPATILMPDLPALMQCLTAKGQPGDLMFLDTLSQFVEECRVEVADGKEPVAANVGASHRHRFAAATEVCGDQVSAMRLRTIDTVDDIAEGVAHLTRVDRRLKLVAKTAGTLPLRRREPGLTGLARIIVGQQLSVASANAIWNRFAEAFPEMTADALHRAREPRYRKAGMSGPKIRTLRAIAAAVRSGLDLDALAHLSAEQAHTTLTEIHGIGPWTADIYPVFCLGHPDIFPVGDLALRNAVADAFGLPTPIDPVEVAAIAEHWSPWRSVAATLFWAYYGAKRAKVLVPV